VGAKSRGAHANRVFGHCAVSPKEELTPTCCQLLGRVVGDAPRQDLPRLCDFQHVSYHPSERIARALLCHGWGPNHPCVCAGLLHCRCNDQVAARGAAATIVGQEGCGAGGERARIRAMAHCVRPTAHHLIALRTVATDACSGLTRLRGRRQSGRVPERNCSRQGAGAGCSARIGSRLAIYRHSPPVRPPRSQDRRCSATRAAEWRRGARAQREGRADARTQSSGSIRPAPPRRASLHQGYSPMPCADDSAA